MAIGSCQIHYGTLHDKIGGFQAPGMTFSGCQFHCGALHCYWQWPIPDRWLLLIPIRSLEWLLAVAKSKMKHCNEFGL
jgi:hypothetical protein